MVNWRRLVESEKYALHGPAKSITFAPFLSWGCLMAEIIPYEPGQVMLPRD